MRRSDDYDIEELIGGPVDDPEDEAPEVQQRDFLKAKATASLQNDIAATAALPAISTGVTVTWLASAFRMDRKTVAKKLAACPAIRQGRGGTPIYDFVQATGYLVRPRFDIREYIKTMKADELPPALQKDYWTAAKSRQQYMEKARDLWRTSDVFEVMGEVFKRIKTTVQLWPEMVEREHGLTAEQRITVTRMGDELLDMIHKSICTMRQERQTRSQVTEVDGIDDL